MADGAFLFAKLETATADGRLCNCPILNGVASALLSATCRSPNPGPTSSAQSCGNAYAVPIGVALVVDRPTSARWRLLCRWGASVAVPAD